MCDQFLLCEGWPARATLPPGTPDHPQYESSCMASYHTLERKKKINREHKNTAINHAKVCEHTAIFLIRAILTLLLAIAVWVQFTDTLPIPTAEGELWTLLQHYSWTTGHASLVMVPEIHVSIAHTMVHADFSNHIVKCECCEKCCMSLKNVKSCEQFGKCRNQQSHCKQNCRNQIPFHSPYSKFYAGVSISTCPSLYLCHSTCIFFTWGHIINFWKFLSAISQCQL